MLFAAPPELESAWKDDFAPLTRIGEILPGSGLVLDENGKEYKLKRSGYEH